MIFDRLTIECDERDGWVRFARAESAEQIGFHLRSGFGPADVRRAALATGWVHGRDGELFVDAARHSRLPEFVAAILDYFDAPDTPSKQLLLVQQTAAEWFSSGDISDEVWVSIPLEAFAWLDICVRDDAADEMRSSADIWRREPLRVSLDEVRRRHIEEMIQRYAPQQRAVEPFGKMAASSRSRGLASQRAKTG